MTHVLKRHPLPFFFILAFLLSWGVWLTSVAQARGIIAWHIPQSLAFWSLTIASFLAAWLTGGWMAVRDLLARMLRWRVPFIWYGVAVLLFPLLCALAAVPYRMSGGAIGQDLALGQAPVYLLVQIPFFLITEETAWRGFALPRLQRRYSALTASLFLGLIWGLWHIPLFLIPGSFQSRISFIGFVVSAVALSVLTTWVFNNTNGSVLLTAILHAFTDGSIAALGVMGSGPALFWLFVGLMWVAALAVILVFGPANLSKRPSTRSQASYNPPTIPRSR